MINYNINESVLNSTTRQIQNVGNCPDCPDCPDCPELDYSRYIWDSRFTSMGDVFINKRTCGEYILGNRWLYSTNNQPYIFKSAYDDSTQALDQDGNPLYINFFNTANYKIDYKVIYSLERNGTYLMDFYSDPYNYNNAGKTIYYSNDDSKLFTVNGNNVWANRVVEGAKWLAVGGDEGELKRIEYLDQLNNKTGLLFICLKDKQLNKTYEYEGTINGGNYLGLKPSDEAPMCYVVGGLKHLSEMSATKKGMEILTLYDWTITDYPKAAYGLKELVLDPQSHLLGLPQGLIRHIDKITVNTDNFAKAFMCYYGEELPYVDMSNVDNISMAFASCRYLKTLPKLDFSSIALDTNTSNAFYLSDRLENVGGFTGLKVNLTIASLNLTVESLMNIINEAADLTGQVAKTLTIGERNLAKLTDEQKAVATAKNWILM